MPSRGTSAYAAKIAFYGRGGRTVEAMCDAEDLDCMQEIRKLADIPDNTSVIRTALDHLYLCLLRGDDVFVLSRPKGRKRKTELT